MNRKLKPNNALNQRAAEDRPPLKLTRPEVSKLTPVNTRNSQITKLSPAESRWAKSRLTDIQELYKPVYKNPRNYSKILSKVAHLELKKLIN